MRACVGILLAGSVAVSVGLLGTLGASAQYVEYPKTEGQVQPLTEGELPPWMTLDMEIRGRTENQTAINNIPGEDRAYELTRVRGGLQVRPLPWLTGYVQFQDAHALGLPLRYTAANMRDTFDFRQAYLEYHYEPVSIFAGRQELKFGGERLVGISDWTNVSRTFDGFDMRIGDKNCVDVFSASVVAIYPESLDRHLGGLNFHGVYGSINTLLPKTSIEPFVFVKTMPHVSDPQGVAGAELEVTPGVFVSGNLPGKFDYAANGALQRASYSQDSIHAGAGFAKFGYTASYLPWSPRLQGEYDYATGNSDHRPGRIGTFDQLYPNNHDVFGLVDLFGWQNIKQRRMNLSL
jgi:hypothetical protein